MTSFYSRKLYSLLNVSLSGILSKLESKEIGLKFEHSSLEPFIYI